MTRGRKDRLPHHPTARRTPAYRSSGPWAQEPPTAPAMSAWRKATLPPPGFPARPVRLDSAQLRGDEGRIRPGNGVWWMFWIWVVGQGVGGRVVSRRSSPVLRERGTTRSVVEREATGVEGGALAATIAQAAPPSTSLRLVPLPRKRGEESRLKTLGAILQSAILSRSRERGTTRSVVEREATDAEGGALLQLSRKRHPLHQPAAGPPPPQAG